MSRIVGIDLGTTNSLVAVVEAGLPLVLADAAGQRLTPSVVHYPENGDPVVGQAARRLRVLRPEETVYSIKRFIGRRANEISETEREVSYFLKGSGASPVAVEIHGRRHSPEEISAEILRQLKGQAEQSLGEPVERAVITVPAYFNDAQRNSTVRAGEMAGLKVERIVNEPTAAALAYGLERLKEKSKIAVYDLGGGTFDLSILELHEGVFQVLATHGNTRLGGDDLDRRLTEWLLREIRAAGGPEARNNPALISRVREAAEEAKIRLSSETEVEIQLPFLTETFNFSRGLRREELERLTGDIVERTRGHCLRSLADARLEPEALDQVILVGGQTRMPLVRRLVAEIFRCSEFEGATGEVRLGSRDYEREGPVLNTSQNPDEAVALGAAIQAEILAGGFKHVLLLDVTPLSLGLETFGGLMNVIIPRNSTIPLKAGEMFTTAVDYQKSMLIHVLQGERERAADNWSLGKFAIDFEAGPKGAARVGVQFEIDANGILHVLARDIRTGREKTVELKSAVDVSDADVQRMVEESVEHAFDDLRARQWVEAKLRAGETVQATRKALAECGEALAGEDRGKIEAILPQLEAALEQSEGSPQQIQRLHAELDDATRPLADLLMERAMESALKKRGVIS